MPAFSIDPAPKGGFQGHFWGDNGELVWWTEVYEQKVSAQHAVFLMKRYAASAPVYDRAKAA